MGWLSDLFQTVQIASFRSSTSSLQHLARDHKCQPETCRFLKMVLRPLDSVGCYVTLPETNTLHLKKACIKRKELSSSFNFSCFRCYLSCVTGESMVPIFAFRIMAHVLHRKPVVQATCFCRSFPYLRCLDFRLPCLESLERHLHAVFNNTSHKFGKIWWKNIPSLKKTCRWYVEFWCSACLWIVIEIDGRLFCRYLHFTLVWIVGR